MAFTPAKMTEADLYGNRILIVDDADITRELIAIYLRSAGYQNIQMAADGFEALEMVKTFNPQLMILDLIMPNKDGTQVLKELRANPSTRKLPILVQTTLTNAEDRNEAWKSGATDIITKPTHKLELLSRVKVQLENGFLIRALEDYQQIADQEIARALDLQHSLLPSKEQIGYLEKKYNLCIKSLYLPSRFLSGDMWGMYEITENKVLVWICDFSGKGIGASLNILRVHTLISEFRGKFKNPLELLNALNTRLVDMVEVGNFCTFIIGTLDFDTKKFDYVAACFTHPLLYQPSKHGYIWGDGSGLPVGICSDPAYELRSLPFDTGDSLVLYSDLMWEDQGGIPGISFTPEELPSLLAKLNGRKFVDIINDQIERLEDISFSDDLTLIEISF